MQIKCNDIDRTFRSMAGLQFFFIKENSTKCGNINRKNKEFNLSQFQPITPLYIENRQPCHIAMEKYGKYSNTLKQYSANNVKHIY